MIHETMLVRSQHLTYFEQHGELFAFHNLFGYIIGMSHDLVELIEFHREQPQTRTEVDERFGDHFETEQLDEFLTILQSYNVLVESQLEEERSVWRMVPVRARWVVYHQPNETNLTFWRSIGKTSEADPYPAWASIFWSEIDNERTVGQIIAELRDDPTLDAEPLDDTTVLETLGQWVHHERQYLKLAIAPLQTFGAPHKWPSYIRSTMPYRTWEPTSAAPHRALDPLATPLNPPHAYYASNVSDAAEQFDMVETTLSHLFRHETPLLGGLSFSHALMLELDARGLIHEQVRHIVEVGAGCGDFAAGVLHYLRDKYPEIYANVDYEIIDLSPTLRQAQKQRLQEVGVLDHVRWTAVNAELWTPAPESIDLLLSNEVVGDFSTVRLTRKLLLMESAPELSGVIEHWPDTLRARLGEAGKLIERYTIPLHDAPDSFYFQVGALKFIAKICDALRPGAGFYLSESGDSVKYPVASTHLDHLEFSTHFGHAKHVATMHGVEATVEYVQDLIGLDREAKVLETGRTYFQNLRALMAHFGVTLEKRAYTEAMLTDLLGRELSISAIGDLRFRWIDERCMGLAPHEFKALLGCKPPRK
ncbi:MAG: SAM-dependent methyltransferase [Myxococcota bacterium]|nr:SAM-dependent methyltransferase [Myxococcota bacterium]